MAAGRQLRPAEKQLRPADLAEGCYQPLRDFVEIKLLDMIAVLSFAIEETERFLVLVCLFAAFEGISPSTKDQAKDSAGKRAQLYQCLLFETTFLGEGKDLVLTEDQRWWSRCVSFDSSLAHNEGGADCCCNYLFCLGLVLQLKKWSFDLLFLACERQNERRCFG